MSTRRKPSLDGAWTRVRRGHEHLTELRTLCEELSDAYAERLEKDLGHLQTRVEVFAAYIERGRVPKPVVPARLSILAGETAYNFRAALDYAMCEWSKLRTPIQRGEGKRRNQFPIESTAKGFRARRNTFMRGLLDRDVDLLKAFQPYRGCKWTSALARFSNTDKHNKLITIRQAMTFAMEHDDETNRLKLEITPYFDATIRRREGLIHTLEMIETHASTFLNILTPKFKR